MADYNTLRPMRPLPDTAKPEASFSLLTYNILAQGKVNREDYPYAAPLTLKWRARKERLAAEIEAYAPDIACFQEMDRFDEFFRPLLSGRLGYELHAVDRGADFNVIAWRPGVFESLATRSISLAATMVERYAEATPNVVVMAALRFRARPELALVVATSHFYWRPEAHDVRRAQMETLLAHLEHFAREISDTPGVSSVVPIVSGDFNSSYSNPCIQCIADEQDGRFSDAYARYRELDDAPRPGFRHGLPSDVWPPAPPSPSFTAASTCPSDASPVAWSDLAAPPDAPSVLENLSSLDLHDDDSAKEVSAASAPSSVQSAASVASGSGSLGLPSAVSFLQAAVPFTTFCQYVWTLDHIFYGSTDYLRNHPPSPVRIEPTALRLLPDQKTVVEAETALPNRDFASDHFALHAVFGVFGS